MEEVGAEAYKGWNLDFFMDQYKTLEKFCSTELKGNEN